MNRQFAFIIPRVNAHSRMLTTMAYHYTGEIVRVGSVDYVVNARRVVGEVEQSRDYLYRYTLTPATRFPNQPS